jgi:hypothetical protein
LKAHYAATKQLPARLLSFFMKAYTLKSFLPMLLALLLLLLLAVFSGCYADNEEDLYPKNPTVTCDTTDVSYSATIRPIMAASCATSGCHAGNPAPGGYNLETHAGLLTAVNSNRLMGTIRHENGYSAMPKNASKLPDCSINQIASWVAAGAPNN